MEVFASVRKEEKEEKNETQRVFISLYLRNGWREFLKFNMLSHKKQ